MAHKLKQEIEELKKQLAEAENRADRATKQLQLEKQLFKEDKDKQLEKFEEKWEEKIRHMEKDFEVRLEDELSKQETSHENSHKQMDSLVTSLSNSRKNLAALREKHTQKEVEADNYKRDYEVVMEQAKKLQIAAANLEKLKVVLRYVCVSGFVFNFRCKKKVLEIRTILDGVIAGLLKNKHTARLVMDIDGVKDYLRERDFIDARSRNAKKRHSKERHSKYAVEPARRVMRRNLQFTLTAAKSLAQIMQDMALDMNQWKSTAHSFFTRNSELTTICLSTEERLRRCTNDFVKTRQEKDRLEDQLAETRDSLSRRPGVIENQRSKSRRAFTSMTPQIPRSLPPETTRTGNLPRPPSSQTHRPSYRAPTPSSNRAPTPTTTSNRALGMSNRAPTPLGNRAQTTRNGRGAGYATARTPSPSPDPTLAPRDKPRGPYFRPPSLVIPRPQSGVRTY